MSHRPNVLCISIDSLRWDVVSCLGAEAETTPALDALAEEGTLFSRAISPSIWTLPVHASVFTGLYPPEHQIVDTTRTLGSHPTFAELLAADGYETRAFYYNRWLGVGNVLRGFGEREATDGDSGSVIPAVAQFMDAISPRLKSVASDVYRSYRDERRHIAEGFFPPKNRDEAQLEELLSALESPTEPFCHFFHTNAAHSPYAPPRPFHRTHTDRSRPGLFWNRAYWQRKIYENQPLGWIGELDPPDREVETLWNLYRGCARYVDSILERIVSRLKDEGLFEETIVVVFGDHGDDIGENGMFGHAFSMTDSLLRVPLVVWDPSGRLPSDTVTRLAQLNDVYPTLLELCGIEPPATKSHSLIPPSRREQAFSYYENTRAQAAAANTDFGSVPESKLPPRRQFCVWASPDRKLIWYPDSDRAASHETTDAGLKRDLESHYHSLEPLSPEDSDVEVDAAVKDHIRDLGYMV